MSVGVWSEISNNQSQLAPPSVFRSSSKNDPECTENPTAPTPCGWLVEYYLFWFGVVGSTICYCVWSRSTGCPTETGFFYVLFTGRAASGSGGEISWRDHLCFGRESLIQPLKGNHTPGWKSAWVRLESLWCTVTSATSVFFSADSTCVIGQ